MFEKVRLCVVLMRLFVLLCFHLNIHSGLHLAEQCIGPKLLPSVKLIVLYAGFRIKSSGPSAMKSHNYIEFYRQTNNSQFIC